MADEPPVDKEEAEDIAERGEAFFADLGIPRSHYITGVLQPALAAAQTNTPDPGQRPWVPLGPRNVGGRIRSLVQDRTAPDTLYAGAGFGGVFRTTDGGDTWEPLGTAADVWPVGCLALAPSDSRILYVGTGEVPRYPGGVGFFRSHDRGATFTRRAASAVPAGGAPAGEAEYYYQIQVDPHHPDRVWIASETGLWRFEPAGAPAAAPVASPPGAFQREPLPTGVTAVTDVVVLDDPAEEPPAVGDPHRLVIYAAVRGRGVYRGRFDRTQPATAVSWTQLGVPFPTAAPAGPVIRIRLAVCETNPRFVYAVAENAAQRMTPVYRSEDGGDHWTATPNAPDPGARFGWWALTLAVHPFRPRLLLAGGLDIYRSTDGGQTWPDKIMDWLKYSRGDRTQHADQHLFLFDARARNRVWAANDGGISVAADVRRPVDSAGFWRKRSHGILAAQLNDITVHPRFPFLMGGGLQDNGTFVGHGGGTWSYVNGGDGGMMAFEPTSPRTFYPTSQGTGPGWNPSGFVVTQMVQSPAAAVVSAAFIRAEVAAEQPAGSRVVASRRNRLPTVGGAPALGTGAFVGKVELVSAGQVLVGQRSGAWLVTGLPAPPASPAAPVCPPAGGSFTPAGSFVSALAVAPSAAATDQWVGTDNGELWRLGAPPGVAPPPVGFQNVTAALPAAHIRFTPAAGGVPAVPGALISRILVHPLDPNYVVVATAGNGAGNVTQGRIFLTLDRGQNWSDISGVGAVAAPAHPLPPCPVTSLAFDPTRGLPDTQILYAGTLVGVFSLQNLPAPRQPAAAGAPPAFAIDWLSFANLNTAVADPARRREIQLPLTLVKDLVSVTILPTQGAAAGSYESRTRFKLRCATFSRGLFECDLDATPANIPRQRLYIRQHLIEDGLHYPRPAAATLNGAAAPPAGVQPFNLAGDPRFPATGSAGAVAFRDTAAYDIRIDSRAGGLTFSFFEGRVDGVEFDEELAVDDLVPAAANVIYVQVHNRGLERVAPVDVHLYFAEMPAAPPAAGAPDLQGNFWAHFKDAALPAAAPAVAPPAAFWQRVGTVDTIPFVRPNQPVVARFDWTPPASLRGKSVALLAVCEGGTDRITAPLPATAMATLRANERRVAVRVARVGNLVRDVYLRDGADDDGTPGSVAFGGRSPDILVVQAEPDDPRAEFRDLTSQRRGDVLKGSSPNFIYVRVFNRGSEPVTVEVELWWAEATLPLAPPDPNAPPTDASKWTRLHPKPAPSLDTATPTIPAGDWGLARFTWDPPLPDPEPNPADPKPYRAMVLMALVRSQPPAPADATVIDDPLPVKGRVRDLTTFWSFFRDLADSNNATLRALRFVP
jgi:photosystem II stability/assembly factor-like uncharacterized protein